MTYNDKNDRAIGQKEKPGHEQTRKSAARYE
jgi:hypothetical protein